MSKVESHSSGLIAAISSTVVALRRQSRLLYHKFITIKARGGFVRFTGAIL